MNYAIGIVTYQPDLQRLRENVAAARDNRLAGHLIIADNHSDSLPDIHDAAADALIISNEENTGIAHALNQICQQALRLGYEWVVTLDQDSVMPPGILDEYARYTSQTDVGIICPAIEDRNTGLEYSPVSEGTEYIAQCITSGNLVRLEAWQRVGGFTEELFIDGVDFDFCIRLRDAGYKILRTHNVRLTQEVGHARRIPLPFHHQMTLLHHSPTRLYYIARNYLYIGRRYQQRAHWTAEVAKRMFIVLCFERDKWQKLRHMLLGIRDYRRGQMGRIDNETT